MKWDVVNRLPIQDKMSEVLRLTLEASRKQLELERKRLRRLQYGG